MFTNILYWKYEKFIIEYLKNVFCCFIFSLFINAKKCVYHFLCFTTVSISLFFLPFYGLLSVGYRAKNRVCPFTNFQHSHNINLVITSSANWFTYVGTHRQTQSTGLQGWGIVIWEKIYFLETDSVIFIQRLTTYKTLSTYTIRVGIIF